ncbi:branched-chain amino acid ABC transporter substrate-binding protein [Virgisporangium aliadipatigenens]|uniref:Branched-chain amino acid ABC transporter substrate-binding protein n=1 Tax=Virgisporangium aliadipatigenens TaxID=741659 RepID=A0A8J3YVC2_9ACTN|nr:ABC transporter substrate-binding protein [Virgisporangium aliadipatigenens]GIJ51198.1 branched-chain amino acid ABC transporter substrate-binding protein [Virgisporangium aliadipatigenens]
MKRIALLAALLALAACSGKAADGDAASVQDVKVDVGVSGNRISLGVLTDLTGQFAPLATELTNAEKLYWEERNAAGGICGTFQVDLDVRDHGYNTQTAVTLYASMKEKNLAFHQILGSPMNAALSPEIQKDRVVSLPGTWAPVLLKNPFMAIVGTTTDLEVVNLLDYLIEQKKLAPGDKVGHIYFEGELGESALIGSKKVAGKQNLTLVEAKIKPTDVDMTAQVTTMKAQNVKAIMVSTSSNALASAAAVAAAQGMRVPILGNTQTFAPGVLKTPGGAYLKEHFLGAQPVAPFDVPQSKAVLDKYLKKYPGTNPTLQVTLGFARGEVMRQLLESACAAKDLTRDGVAKARQGLKKADLGGLAPTMDYSRDGAPPTVDSYLMRAADVPGGLALEKGPYRGPDTA